MRIQNRNHSTVSIVYQVVTNRSLDARCAKWGCPEYTDLPPYVDVGKWSNSHWYCKICEVEVRCFCENPSQVKDSSKTTDLNDRGVNLEQIMDRLEKKMEDMMIEN